MSFYDKQGSSTGGNFRRTWDTKEYEAKATERLNAERDEAEGKHRGPKIKRELLKSRDYKVHHRLAPYFSKFALKSACFDVNLK